VDKLANVGVDCNAQDMVIGINDQPIPPPLQECIEITKLEIQTSDGVLIMPL
jgi:hypothetical protein